MTRASLIDLQLRLHAETERAILVSDDGDREKAVWLPLSQIEVNRRDGAVIDVTAPEWLATEKGLI